MRKGCIETLLADEFILCDVMEEFLNRIDRHGDCWTWLGSRNELGYGIYYCDGLTYRAHRLAWAFENGSSPGSLHVCHVCDNPSCVRPSHLFLGTARDNMLDCKIKGRMSNPPLHSGTSQHLAKLCPEKVVMILADNRSAQKVANDFGVCKKTILNIRHGKIWKDVPR